MINVSFGRPYRSKSMLWLVYFATTVAVIGFATGCKTAPPPPAYVIPNAPLDQLAMVSSSASRIRLIDGAAPKQGMSGTRPVAVAPGKRKVLVEWDIRALGDTRTIATAEFIVDLVAGRRYRFAAKVTDWKLVAWEQDMVLIDEISETLTYLTGENTGEVRPWEQK